ncbi:MAG: fatty acid desaturase [Gammaproteobacteria bacterium]|nr:fatty acid desaturase [Gammaproteobacteria bacterium]MDH3534546.1 fatty acid desaturase [Gammaproteobacteria bacterium]
MEQVPRTNAESSGLEVERNTLKALMRRSDRPGLIWLAKWLLLMVVSGYALHLSFGSLWVVPAMIWYGFALVLPTYSLSHECAHGTAFRMRWLNELMFWLSSLVYIEEPLHRRYAHATHHTYTSIDRLDGQMVFANAYTFPVWLREVSGLGQYLYEFPLLFRNAMGRFSDEVRRYTPANELPRLKWNARAFLLIYIGGGLAAWIFAAHWVWWYIVIPRLVGGPLMIAVTLIQHAESDVDVYDLKQSTRSVRTNPLGEFLYLNMNYHIEHHAHSGVPFFALPELNRQLRERLPEPDPGIIHTNLEVLWVVLKRSLGLDTRAPSIRQGASMLRGQAS